jgi:hypothetical protein
MILLEPNKQNKVALTLSETATLAQPTFLFELQSKQTKEVFTFIAQDGSQYPYRYNLFLIEVKANPNPLQGEVDLTIGDEYIYKVYEQISTTNLDPSLADNLLEVGILLYKYDLTQREIYDYTDTERAVYNG